MATYKEKTIKAVEQLIEKYNNPVGKRFVDKAGCPLCDVHRIDDICRGCPLASKTGSVGCMNSPILTQIVAFGFAKRPAKKEDMLVRPRRVLFERRAVFHSWMLAQLHKIPTRAFTRSGWKPETFQEITDKNLKS